MELEHIINACKVARHFMLIETPEIIREYCGLSIEEQEALRLEIRAELKKQYPDDGGW